MIWGGDFYGMLSPKDFRLYDKRTIRLLYKIKSNNFITFGIRLLGFDYIKHLVSSIIKGNPSFLKELIITLLSCQMKKFLVEKYLNIDAKYLTFNYGSIESLFNFKQYEYLIKCNKILIGNSANPTNNHIAIIDYLSTIKLKQHEIIVPLSYGGDEFYIKYLLNYGFLKLGKNFKPITDFLRKRNI